MVKGQSLTWPQVFTSPRSTIHCCQWRLETPRPASIPLAFDQPAVFIGACQCPQRVTLSVPFRAILNGGLQVRGCKTWNFEGLGIRQVNMGGAIRLPERKSWYGAKPSLGESKRGHEKTKGTFLNKPVHPLFQVGAGWEILENSYLEICFLLLPGTCWSVNLVGISVRIYILRLRTKQRIVRTPMTTCRKRYKSTFSCMSNCLLYSNRNVILTRFMCDFRISGFFSFLAWFTVF